MRQRHGAISAKRLRRAEGLYERARILFGDERADRMAQVVTGATVQLDWKTGVVADAYEEFLWAKYEGDPAAKGWRKYMARFWKNGHELSADYLELTTLKSNLARTYGAKCVSLALAYRVDESDQTVHIGTFREWQEHRIEPVDNTQRVGAFSREGPEAAELSWGVAVEMPKQRVFMPVETQAAARVAVTQCLELGTAVV